ncbi:hypothetical protein AYO20_08069 [Fonsecaea nubica]|uniref:Uncharacterized protein n=1 Tax=Fonsecaea nubica TaxID=856822 RepID=A0A178CQF4_9EURO|nr:hypothetical protein AYO20_08069 [Fonsecaea nubica]OAL31676.1 hypothetical protein AYO20_08069 [Fonsecaea nubica]
MLLRWRQQRREKAEDGPKHLWNSVWLSGPMLGTLAAISAICVTALAVLWHFNEEGDGFTLVTTNHYSWTYGPTAILVLIVAMWRQVDQYCKALVPWQRLKQGNANSAQSVLLDYVSPLQPISLWESFKNRHRVVSTTIISFVVLKLITLLSTGLFFTDGRVVTTPGIVFTGTTMFDASSFNATANLEVADSSFFYRAYAVMVKGLADTEGIQGPIVYQAMLPPAYAQAVNATITTIVDTFVPSFNCEKAAVTVNLQPANSTERHPEDSITLLSPRCNLLAGAQPVYALNPALYECPKRQLSGLMQRVDCSGEDTSNPTGNWQLLTMTDMRYEQTVANSTGDASSIDFEAESWSTGVANMTGIVCRPSYLIERRNLTYDLSERPFKVTLEPVATPSPRPLEGFSNEVLGQLFSSAYVDAALMFGNKADEETAAEYPDTMFETMAQVNGGDYESLLDPDVMIQAAETVFGHVAAQIVAKHLVKQQSSTLTGQETVLQERLYIRELTAWLMAGGFSALILSSLLILYDRPKDVVPHNPEDLVNTAFILAQSPAFEAILNSQSSTAQPSFDQRLAKYHYSTYLNNNAFQGSNLVLDVQPSSDGDESQIQGKNEMWKPLFLQRPMIVLTLVLPVILVAVLETLQRLSVRAIGIAALDATSNLSTAVYTRFIPALAMLLIATCFNALDFNIAVLAPYQALKTCKAGVSPSNCSQLLGKIPVAALWTAVRSRFGSAVFSGLAALLGSVLTIIGSGLLTVEDASTSASAAFALQNVDSFNMSWAHSVLNDNGAAVVSSLIEAANLSYPPLTHGELALPKLQPAQEYSDKYADNTLLSVNVPALRSSLRCDILNKTAYNITGFYNSHILSSSVSIDISYDLPPQCLFGGPGGNLSTLDVQYSFQFPSSTNTSFFGKMLDLHVGPYSGPFADSSDEISPYTQPDNPKGCPSLGFIYGFADASQINSSTVSAMVCYQVVEEVQANLTLLTRDLSVSADNPPIIVANSSSDDVLITGSDSKDVLGNGLTYRIQVHMDQSLSLFNQTQYSSSSLSGPAVVDNFFQAVLFGRTPIRQELLSDGSESSQKQVRMGIQRFYRRYMAQVISSNMRVSLPPLSSTQQQQQQQQQAAADVVSSAPSSPSTLTATVLNIRTPVLRQNNASKLTLQVILGVMFVCGLIAVLLNPTKDVVPHNPCTIAGSAALLAGSRLVEEIAERGHASWTRDDHVRLRLGWWKGDGNAVDKSSSSSSSLEGHDSEGNFPERYGIDKVEKLE